MDATRPLPANPRRLVTFVAHFVEMCIAMCAAGVPLTLGVLALLGGEEFRRTYPQLALLLIALTLTTPMTAWMLFRGMPLRPTLEMAAAAFVVVLGLVAAAAAGVGPGVAATVGDVCGFSCGAMLVVMAARFDLYASGHHHAM